MEKRIKNFWYRLRQIILPQTDVYRRQDYHKPNNAQEEPPIILYIFLFALLFFCILFCISCSSTRNIAKTRATKDSTDIQSHATHNLYHDSIFIRDSVFIHEKTKNDTVYIEKNKIQIRYKDRLVTLHDTFTRLVTVHDTLTDIQVTTKEVKRSSPFLVTSAVLFWLLLLALVGYVGFKIYRRVM